MTDTTARASQAAPQEQVDTTTPANEPGDASAGTKPEQPEPATPNPDLAALEHEAANLKDRLLRTLAEMENLRRRTEREVADARLYGISAFARDLLAVGDNMRRALDAVGDDLRANADPGIKALIDGVDLTERELLKVLEKHGVKKLAPQGTRFDPNFHQAMYEVPDQSVPAGTIVQVIQPGYTIGERMLRPALVAIAKGGPKAAASGAGPQPATADAPANDNSGREQPG